MTTKLDVWRTALSLEGHYVLLVSLTQTLGADCLKGGITHGGVKVVPTTSQSQGSNLEP